MIERFIDPSSVAFPVTRSWSSTVPLVPAISILREPLAVCV